MKKNYTQQKKKSIKTSTEAEDSVNEELMADKKSILQDLVNSHRTLRIEENDVKFLLGGFTSKVFTCEIPPG